MFSRRHIFVFIFLSFSLITCNKRSEITGMVKEYGTNKPIPNIRVDLHEDHTWTFLKSGKMGTDKLIATTHTDGSGNFNFDQRHKDSQYLRVNPQLLSDYWNCIVDATSNEIVLVPTGTIKIHVKNSLSSSLTPMDNLSFQVSAPITQEFDFPGSSADFIFYAKSGGNSYSNKIYWMTVNNQLFSNSHDTTVICPGRDTVSITLAF
jgi:hypothetical protein